MVTALGDSVTVGVGDVGIPAGWAAHLAAAIDSAHFVNLATNGARARDVMERQARIGLAAAPDLVTILVGGNDVLRGDFSAEEVGWRVSSVTESARSRGADVLVVLLHDPRQTAPAPKLVRRVLADRADRVNREVTGRLARRQRVAILDPRSLPGSGESTLWHIDRMHPSAAGHRELARGALDCLKPLGWTPVSNVPEPPAMPTSRLRQAAWLLRHGVPWFAKRSTDLLPELAWTCWRESRRGLSR